MKASPADIDAAIRTGSLGTATVFDRTPQADIQPVDWLLKGTEAAFQSDVMRLAKRCHWRCYHTRDSRKSEKGFPDLVLLRGRMLVRELKTNAGKVTPEQEEWLAAFLAADIDARVWRPRDWSIIIRELT